MGRLALVDPTRQREEEERLAACLFTEWEPGFIPSQGNEAA
jgi:hypothetical protein